MVPYRQLKFSDVMLFEEETLFLDNEERATAAASVGIQTKFLLSYVPHY